MRWAISTIPRYDISEGKLRSKGNQQKSGSAVNPTLRKIRSIFYRQAVVTGFTTVPRVVGFTQQVTVIPGVSGAPGRQVVSNVPITINTPVVVQDREPVRETVRLPPDGRYTGVSVVDNGNVLPVDQVYAGYNFYSNAGAALNPLVGGSDLQRRTAGFEKRLLDGNASIGTRLPFVQQYGPVGLWTQKGGDLAVLLEIRLLHHPGQTGSASGGLASTAPTGGGSALLADGAPTPYSWLFQPWGGCVQRFGRTVYCQGKLTADDYGCDHHPRCFAVWLAGGGIKRP